MKFHILPKNRATLLALVVILSIAFGLGSASQASAGNRAQDGAPGTPAPRGASFGAATRTIYLPILFNNAFSFDGNLPPTRVPATPVPAATPFPPPAGGTVATFTISGDTIVVDGPGLLLTLPELEAGVNTAGLRPGAALVNGGNGIWTLNVNLRMGPGVTLKMTPATVSELRLRSESNTSGTSIDNTLIAVLDSIDGAIEMDGIRVTSWNGTGPDVTPKDGRAYLRAVGAAHMDILNSDIGYLGSPDGGGSYGISWRDELKNGGDFAARVTGKVVNSNIHHLYYGFFSFAASGMLIKGNQFHDNYSYGFDPHDFSHGFFVEDNAAFNNGNHGFIISRGCHDFVFRRNKSYNNTYHVDSNLYRAHGFMLDPGGLNSTGGDYTPSYNNTVEDNEAYGNQGFGIRILDANDNVVRNNNFHNNLRGISIERASAGNMILANQLINNAERGLAIFDSAANNYVIGNNVSGNAAEGVYFADSAHLNHVEQNTIASNGTGIRAIASTDENYWIRNSLYGNGAAIIVITGVNSGMLPPYNLGASGATLTGKARVGAAIDVYSDGGGQARFYEGRAVADGAGNWSFSKTGPWQAGRLSAIASSDARGSSVLSASVAVP